MHELKKIYPLLWVALSDSLGWGIAFSAAAALILSQHSNFVSPHMSSSLRYIIYELILAIYSVFTFFFSPVLGGVSDHYGRKPALILAMSGLTFGFVLCVLACWWRSLSLLIVGRIIAGMMAGSVSVAQAAVVDLSTEKTKPRYLSLMTLVNCAGMTLGPVLGGVLMHFEVGPAGMTTFAVGGLISLIGLLAVFYHFDETFFASGVKSKWDLLAGFSNIKTAFFKPVAGLYLLVFILTMMAYVLCFSNMPLLLHRVFSSSSATIGLVLGSFGFFLSLSLIFGGKYLFNYFKVPHLVWCLQSIQVFIYLGFLGVLYQFNLIVVLFASIAIIVAQLYVGLITLVSDATEATWQGRMMGVISALFAVPWAVGPLLAGSLNHLSVGAVFIVCALLMLSSLLVYYFARSKQMLLSVQHD